MRRRRLSPNTVLRAAALVLSGTAAFALFWSVIPAPTWPLYLVGVAASEWGLWLAALGAAGAGLALLAARNDRIAVRRRRRGGGGAATPPSSPRARKVGTAALLLGLMSVLVGLLPLAVTLPVAEKRGVALSLPRYLGLTDDPLLRTNPVTVRRNIPYLTVGGQTLALDVYSGGSGLASAAPPSIVVIHGGGWRGGQRSDFADWDRWLAAEGYVVFDADYRVAPPPNWRESTGDVKSAVAWVQRHAPEYGADGSRIALLGRSAGGHLALLAAYSHGDPRLPPSDGLPEPLTSPVKAVVSFYGPTDLLWGYNHPAVPDVIDGPGTLRRFLGGTPAEVPDAYTVASPITHVQTPLLTPATLLFHGERDLVVGPQHSRFLANRLESAGIGHDAVFIPYALHGFDFHRNGWGGQVAQAVLLRFLRERLGP